jgi:hypothetical protein
VPNKPTLTKAEALQRIPNYSDLLRTVGDISAVRQRKLDELAEIASEEFKGAADVAINALHQIIRILKELEEKEKEALALLMKS